VIAKPTGAEIMADKYVISKETVPRKYWHLTLVTHRPKYSQADQENDRTVFEGQPYYHLRDLVGLQSKTTFQVNCCKSRHTVSYDYKGKLTLHNHDDDDLEQLRMLRTFGGGISRCLQIKEQLEAALSHQGHMGFQHAYWGDEDAYRALPKNIFHYRRSRCETIRNLRRTYKYKVEQSCDYKTAFWERPKSERLNNMYAKLWNSITAAHGTCPYVSTSKRHYAPFVGNLVSVDRWQWYRHVYMRGLTSAVYGAPSKYRGERCYVIGSDPNWMLGDKTLRVTYLQETYRRDSPHHTTDMIYTGTAHLEDKWYIHPDEDSSLLKWDGGK
tara:strand:- start:2125 stop:3105 length:981 start_codon:yes stop_codon:yes gene_type:complete